jgi:hypothetical protein
MEQGVRRKSEAVDREVIRYFSVSVIKYHDQGNLKEKGFTQEHLCCLSNWHNSLTSHLSYKTTKIFLDIVDVSRCWGLVLCLSLVPKIIRKVACPDSEGPCPQLAFD